MKIIFLDIDGVLNSERYYITVDRDRAGWNRFDPKVVSFIKKLIEELSVKLVISSSWRFGAFPQLKIELNKSGLTKYLHKDWNTPRIYPSHRGTEIKMWLDEHSEVENYVIIDDDINILEEQMAHYIQTDLKNGMLYAHYLKAREILNTKTLE